MSTSWDRSISPVFVFACIKFYCIALYMLF